jgi:hypothetical protein
MEDLTPVLEMLIANKAKLDEKYNSPEVQAEVSEMIRKNNKQYAAKLRSMRPTPEDLRRPFDI